jgi:CRP-like cAMP-binding protein
MEILCQGTDGEKAMRKGELGKLYSDGEVLCREGEEGSAMYVIQTGQVKITKKTDSKEVEIAELYAGDIFGEMALFEKQPRSATATASGEARVLSVDRKKLFQLIDRDPMLVLKILESMSQRIRKMDEELARLKNI